MVNIKKENLGGKISLVNIFCLFCQEATTWLKQKQQMLAETFVGEIDVISEMKADLKRIKIELIQVEIQTYLLDKRTREAEEINKKLVKDVEKWKKNILF